MSYFFETSPFNLFKDIEVLYDYATKNKINLRGYEIYKFFVNFEDKSMEEIQDFFEKFKEYFLKEILYDDYIFAKYYMIENINKSLIDIDSLNPIQIIDGIKVYDITDNPNYILAHSTNTPIKRTREFSNLLENMKKGSVSNISLSLQSKDKFAFVDLGIVDIFVKFAYGNLDPSRVGIIYKQDVYSVDINNIDGSVEYVRGLYSPEELMAKTLNYNEIVYLISGKPLLPQAIICEEMITKAEMKIAKALNIPIFFRKEKCESKYIESDNPRKRYLENPKEMLLF